MSCQGQAVSPHPLAAQRGSTEWDAWSHWFHSGANVAGRPRSSGVLEPAEHRHQVTVMPPSPGRRQGGGRTLPHPTAKHPMVPTSHFPPMSKAIGHTSRRKIHLAWVIVLNFGQSWTRSDKWGDLPLMDVFSAGPLCQARAVRFGRAFLEYSALGHWDDLCSPPLLPPCSWRLTGNLQAASYSGDFFEFLWGWLWLSQRLQKKEIARWERLVIESIFLFWMGKPELGETGINYSTAEFCCRKWISNLLQKALCARCSAGNAARLTI